jgi:hypothetical protein
MQGVRSPELQAASRNVMEAAARNGVVMIGGPMVAISNSSSPHRAKLIFRGLFEMVDDVDLNKRFGCGELEA